MSTINTYERADQLFRVINSPFGQLPAPKLYNWEEFYELQLKHLSNYWHYSSRLLARSLNRTFIDNWRFSNNCFHRGQDPVSEARAFDQEKCDAASTKKQGMFQVSFLIHISFRDCCSFILKVTKTGRYHSTGYFLSRQNHANDSIPITTAVAAVPKTVKITVQEVDHVSSTFPAKRQRRKICITSRRRSRFTTNNNVSLQGDH